MCLQISTIEKLYFIPLACSNSKIFSVIRFWMFVQEKEERVFCPWPNSHFRQFTPIHVFSLYPLK